MIFREKQQFRFFDVGKFKGAELISIITSTIAFYFAFSLLPIIRRDFGQRSFDLSHIFLIIGAFFFLSTISNFGKLGLVLFIGTIAYHSYVVRKRAKNGDNWFSRSLGQSYLMQTPLSIKYSENILHRFVEPIIVCVIGLFFFKIDYFFGMYLITAGIGIAIIENQLHQQFWHNMLDQIDSDILSKFYNKQLKQALDGDETNGAGAAPSLSSSDGVRNPHNTNIAVNIVNYYEDKRNETDDEEIFI